MKSGVVRSRGMGVAVAVGIGIAAAVAVGGEDDRAGSAAADGAAGALAADGAEEAIADSLVGRWIEALGGMDTYRDVRTARYTLTTELYDPATGRLQRARPRYVALSRASGGELARIERWVWDGSRFVVQAFDGDTARAYLDGEPAPSGQMDAEEARYVTSDVFYWFSLPFKLRDPGARLHYDGRDEDGRHVVRVTFGEGVGDHQDVWWYLFEDDRTWPVETRYQTDGTGGITRLRWEGIRSEGGYFYPEERVYLDEQDRVWKILRMSDVELGPELPEGAFRNPSASPWGGGG